MRTRGEARGSRDGLSKRSTPKGKTRVARWWRSDASDLLALVTGAVIVPSTSRLCRSGSSAHDAAVYWSLHWSSFYDILVQQSL